MKQLMIVPAFLLTAVFTCSAQDGKQVYMDKCATCHGADGAAKTARGKQLKVKGAAASAKVSLSELVKIVEIGKGLDMPSYAKQLTAPQIQAVTEYYRSLAK